MNIHRNAHRYVPVFVLALLVVASLACGESSPAEEPRVSTATPEAAETQAPSEGAAKTPEPATAPADTPQPQLLYLGDIVEQYGSLLCAIKVEDPTTPGMLYEPEQGKKLVAVEVIVGNVSTEALSANPLNATLVDSAGFTYQPELAGRDGQIPTADLTPGEKAKGWIAFEIPEGATAASMKYAVDVFGSEVLRASLAAPPEGHVPNPEALSVLPPSPEARLGDIFEQYGFSLSATGVEDPATPGMLYEAKEGYKLVAVEIVVGNVSGETLSVNPLDATLVDSEGFVYQPELAGRDGQLAVVDLNAGEKAKGWVAFEVPGDAAPASIKYLVEMFSTKFLLVGLSP